MRLAGGLGEEKVQGQLRDLEAFCQVLCQVFCQVLLDLPEPLLDWERGLGYNRSNERKEAEAHVQAGGRDR